MERLGFYVCVVDLEDELVRALGAAAVEQVLDARGDPVSFRSFQKEPAWRGKRRRGNSGSPRSCAVPLGAAAD
jgi:hypothetical protein